MLGKERNNNLNEEQFTDFAWSEMSKMLDQEMPVAAPASAGKKRYGLLLLVLLIGFVSGIGTMWVLQDEIPDDYEQMPLQQLDKLPDRDATAKARIRKDAAETAALATTSQANKNIEDEIAGSLTKQKNPINETSTNTLKTLNDQKLYTNSSSVVVKENSSNVQHKSKEVIIDVQTMASTINLSKTNGFGQKHSNEISLDLPNRVNELSRLVNRGISLLEVPVKVPVLSLQMLQEKPKMNYGLYVGAQTRNFEGMHGLTAGLYVSYSLDHRFSLRSGVGFSQVSGFQSNTLGITEPLTPSYFEPIAFDPNEFSTVSSLTSNQDLPVQNLKYLDIPFALDYRMSNHFGIIMGMKFSYLLDADVDGYVTEDLNERDAQLLNDALYGSMRKMDMATVLGFAIYPSSKIGLELKYNHGLIDYTIDQRWHVRQLNSNKTFEMSFNYFIR